MPQIKLNAKARRRRWWRLLLVTLSLCALALIFIFALTPEDAFQGIVQKIFYIHVTSAWLGFLGTGLCALFSALYLIKRESRWDTIAQPFGEISLLFISAVLVTGPFWAKPIWGTYWTWDPRLTSTFILWLIFCGYFLARSTISDLLRRKLVASFLAILGALDVPFVHVSVLLFRTLHPSPVVLNPQGIGKNLDPRMGMTLAFTLFSFTLFFFNLYTIRYCQIKEKEAL